MSLLWDYDKKQSGIGYIASGHEPIVYIVDMNTYETLNVFNYSQPTKDVSCRGQWWRNMAYSTKNQHLFVACHWDGPILELRVDAYQYELTKDQAPTIFLVAIHYNASGTLYEDVNSGIVVATDKEKNMLHVFYPGANGESSSVEWKIAVPGHPDTVSFYFPGNDDSYVLCMPLTENTNRNNIDKDDNVVCDHYSCGPPITEDDVKHGMCLYDTNTTKDLLRVPLEKMDMVKAEQAPYFPCPRCKEVHSYWGGDICTCTPRCGSCATPDYDSTRSGVQCVKFQKQIGQAMIPSLMKKMIWNAGAVEQSPSNFWGKQCSYGHTHRAHKRGEKYDASIAHYPANSLQIIDMSTQTFKCQVDLPGKPFRVVYVPPQHRQRTFGDEKQQQFQWIIIALVTFITTFFMVLLILRVLDQKDQRARIKRSVNKEDTEEMIEITASGHSNLPEVT